MLKKYIHLLSFVFIATSAPLVASSLPSSLSSVDCLSINQHTDKMLEYIDDGTFRYSNDVDEDNLNFSFEAAIPYAEYITYASKNIALRKPLAELPCPLFTDTYKLIATQNNWAGITKVKHLVAPFELTQENNQKAILLIHGLTDSPYLFHDLAYFFYQQGFNVRTLLLPGHGTAPSDLIDVDYEDWQQAADYAINRTLADYEQVYLGGFSTGGALIFNHLMQQEYVSEKIKGLLMWSPASKAKSDIAWLARYIDYVPFMDWVDKDADIDFAKYESFPFNAGAQVHGLMENIVGEDARAENKFHNIPLWVAASEHDQTIATESTLELINHWHTGRQILNSDEELATTLPASSVETTLVYFGDISAAETKLSSTIKLISPSCEQEGICKEVLNVAHTATTNSPENPHYGNAGQYRNCGHYLADLERYQECKTTDELYMGELTEINLSKDKLIQRLTFNPYYQKMLSHIKVFIQ